MGKRYKGVILLLLLAVICITVLPDVAYAEEAKKAADAAKNGLGMFDTEDKTLNNILKEILIYCKTAVDSSHLMKPAIYLWVCLGAIEIATNFSLYEGQIRLSQMIGTIMKMTFYVFLIYNWFDFCIMIQDFMTRMAMIAADLGGSMEALPGPSDIWDYGCAAISKLWGNIDITSPIETLVRILATLGILLGFAKISIDVFITYVEFGIFMALSIIFLPFNVCRFTEGFGKSVFNGLVSFGARLMMVNFLTGLLFHIINIHEIIKEKVEKGNIITISSTIQLACIMLTIAYLFGKAAEFAQSLVSGSGPVSSGTGLMASAKQNTVGKVAGSAAAAGKIAGLTSAILNQPAMKAAGQIAGAAATLGGGPAVVAAANAMNAAEKVSAATEAAEATLGGDGDKGESKSGEDGKMGESGKSADKSGSKPDSKPDGSSTTTPPGGAPTGTPSGTSGETSGDTETSGNAESSKDGGEEKPPVPLDKDVEEMRANAEANGMNHEEAQQKAEEVQNLGDKANRDRYADLVREGKTHDEAIAAVKERDGLESWQQDKYDRLRSRGMSHEDAMKQAKTETLRDQLRNMGEKDSSKRALGEWLASTGEGKGSISAMSTMGKIARNGAVSGLAFASQKSERFNTAINSDVAKAAMETGKKAFGKVESVASAANDVRKSAGNTWNEMKVNSPGLRFAAAVGSAIGGLAMHNLWGGYYYQGVRQVMNDIKERQAIKDGTAFTRDVDPDIYQRR